MNDRRPHSGVMTGRRRRRQRHPIKADADDTPFFDLRRRHTVGFRAVGRRDAPPPAEDGGPRRRHQEVRSPRWSGGRSASTRPTPPRRTSARPAAAENGRTSARIPTPRPLRWGPAAEAAELWVSDRGVFPEFVAVEDPSSLETATRTFDFVRMLGEACWGKNS